MVVRVAVSAFGEEVSPRFCQASRALMFDCAQGVAVPCGQVELGDSPYPARLTRLASLGVRVLVCGAFPRAFVPHAHGLGIRVIWGLSGPVARLEPRLPDLVQGNVDGRCGVRDLPASPADTSEPAGR